MFPIRVPYDNAGDALPAGLPAGLIAAQADGAIPNVRKSSCIGRRVDARPSLCLLLRDGSRARSSSFLRSPARIKPRPYRSGSGRLISSADEPQPKHDLAALTR